MAHKNTGGVLSLQSFGIRRALIVLALTALGIFAATAQTDKRRAATTDFETVCKGSYKSNFDCTSEYVPREDIYSTTKIGSTVEVDFTRRFFVFTSGGFSRNFYFDRADVIENQKGEVWILERVDGDFENVRWHLEFQDGQITSVHYGSSFFHRRTVSDANPPSAVKAKQSIRG